MAMKKWGKNLSSDIHEIPRPRSLEGAGFPIDHLPSFDTPVKKNEKGINWKKSEQDYVVTKSQGEGREKDEVKNSDDVEWDYLP